MCVSVSHARPCAAATSRAAASERQSRAEEEEEGGSRGDYREINSEARQKTLEKDVDGFK